MLLDELKSGTKVYIQFTKGLTSDIPKRFLGKKGIIVRRQLRADSYDEKAYRVRIENDKIRTLWGHEFIIIK